MAIVRDFREPNAQEATEHLRVIREMMERSTRFSTFSGLSGILAGSASIAGCVATHSLNLRYGSPNEYAATFLLLWSLVILFAIGSDYALTKRRAAQVGKHIRSRLGKQMILASGPGLGTGAILTLYLMQNHLLGQVYPIWMLCYGIAVSAVGLFSQREVSLLGGAFLLVGALTLLLFPAQGLILTALSFGGFHIIYGILMGRKDRW